VALLEKSAGRSLQMLVHGGISSLERICRCTDQ
jgi:hypothetical protein